MSAEGRPNTVKNSSQTKNRRGRPRKAHKKAVRISFRVTWPTYKRLLHEAGGKGRLSGFIRWRLGLETRARGSNRLRKLRVVNGRERG